MKKKTKRNISIVLDVLLVLMIALILAISINAIVSKNKGYTSFFGKVVYAVETDSMKGNYPGSFDKHALIFCKELKTEEEKKSLKVNDVVTFWFRKDGVRALNTHRIVQVLDQGGPNCQYVTKGDNVAQPDGEQVMWNDVVAIYSSKIDGIGAVVLFAQSSTGFFIIAVIPSLLLFGYCIVLFYSAIKKVAKKKAASAIIADLDLSDEEREELKRQFLSEMMAAEAAKNASPPTNQQTESTETEKKE